MVKQKFPPRIMYIEYKGDGLHGTARIGRVTFSVKGASFSVKGTGFSVKGTGFSVKGTGFSPYIQATNKISGL